MNKGDTIEHKFIVTDKIHQGFVALFNDKNPLHTNPDFARSKGFEGQVMHGNILNGFLSFFVGELLPVKNVVIHSQEIKFYNPVYLNDEVTLKTVVSDIIESVNTIIFTFEFLNKKNQRLAKGKIQIGII